MLLLDAEDRVLLFRGIDPAAAGEPFWFTPGGGADPGETLEQTALRELAEETGCRDAVLGPPLWTRVAEFDFDGVSYRQSETFFLARTEAFDVDMSGFTELEQRAVADPRWWTGAELEATEDLVYPTRLAALLRTLLADGPPIRPYEVGV